MSLELTIQLMRTLLFVSILIQTSELLSISRQWREGGLWSWRIVRRDFADFPFGFRLLLDLLMNPLAIFLMLITRLVIAFVFLFGSLEGTEWIGPLLTVVLVTHIVLCLRWRGSVNGGSDFMTLTVLIALILGELVQPEYKRGIVYFVAVQCVTSYFVAGIIKLINADWRSGLALRVFVRQTLTTGRIPRLFAGANQLPLQIFTWIVILFEILFPLALMSPGLALILMLIAFSFHLGTVFLFGLNRFIWAWLTCYPAVFYTAVALTHR